MDNTVEIVVYLTVALVIGGMVILMVGNFNGGATYDKIKSFFGEKPLPAYAQVDSAMVAPTLYKLWEDCGLGTKAKNMTIQYRDGNKPSVDMPFIFDNIRKAGLCGSFSSTSNGCGATEDLRMPVSGLLEDNRIYRATCDPNQRVMVIT